MWYIKGSCGNSKGVFSDPNTSQRNHFGLKTTPLERDSSLSAPGAMTLALALLVP